MKVEQVLGQKLLTAGLAGQPLARVRPHVGLVGALLPEALAAQVAGELFDPEVDEGVPLEAGRVGEGLGALSKQPTRS